MNALLKGLAWMTAMINVPADAEAKHDERGAAFTEYVVLLAIVVGIVVTVLVATLGPALTAAVGRVVTAVNGA